MAIDTRVIHPGKLAGKIAAPPSKSVMQRLLAILLLRNASLIIHNAGHSADDEVVKKILTTAGFVFNQLREGSLEVVAPADGSGNLTTVNFGESGLAARMFIPILALRDTKIMLDAAPALRLRPMPFLNDVLPKLGVTVHSTNEGLPADIQGPYTPGDIDIDGSLSSQFLTGLLLSYAGAVVDDTTIRVSNLVSRPYIDLTLRMMQDMGMNLPRNEDYRTFCFTRGAGTAASIPDTYNIEGDWSAASFWLVAGAMSGPLVVTGLDAFSAQADKQILSALMDAGAALSIESSQITVGPAALKAFHFDATDCPDLFPPLAVLACYAEGTSVIEGIGRLIYKESNRALSIQSELEKMGADISFQGDMMIIRGGKVLKAATMDSHNDHRIAMMCAIAALGAEGTSSIMGAGAVKKSYPGFFDDLQGLGAQVSGSQ